MKIPASEIKAGMIIDDGSDVVVVAEVWPSQGPGLGIMTKSRRVSDAKHIERRYIDEDQEVKLIVREPTDD